MREAAVLKATIDLPASSQHSNTHTGLNHYRHRGTARAEGWWERWASKRVSGRTKLACVVYVSSFDVQRWRVWTGRRERVIGEGRVAGTWRAVNLSCLTHARALIVTHATCH
ncbi:hypothetical protein E2C01_098265 [Portunus trituberculatus]|uniref:Uncharacterized protein n=1 Tax=Portunus trituberculatus TaxID=210409 RepID=A0A5B7K6M5_PORTR|nr:hypothetical protein [Portunus trituberculatus]